MKRSCADVPTIATIRILLFGSFYQQFLDSNPPRRGYVLHSLGQHVLEKENDRCFLLNGASSNNNTGITITVTGTLYSSTLLKKDYSYYNAYEVEITEDVVASSKSVVFIITTVCCYLHLTTGTYAGGRTIVDTTNVTSGWSNR